MEKITRITRRWATLPLAAFLAAALPLAQAGEDKPHKNKDGRETASYEKKDHKNNRGQSAQKALKGSSLEGMDLVGEDGETIASVDDVIINPRNGNIEAVVATTGFLGIGGEEKRINIDDLDPKSLADRNIRTTLSNDDFNNLDRFNASELEERSSRDGEYQTREFLGMSMRGRDVVSEDGSQLGEFEDWVVSIEEGIAPYLIVRSAPVIPSDNRFNYHAVSTDTLRGLNDAGEIVVGISEDQFASAESAGDGSALDTREGDVYLFEVDASSSAASYRMDD